MVDISRPVNRTVKTDIAGSVVVTPSGGSTGTPIVAADLTNGFAPITVSFAAGETTKNAVFGVVDDSAVEGTETYRLTMSNPQPSGTFNDGAFVEGTVADNDSATGPTIIYGPTSTQDTGARETNSRQHKVSTTWRSDSLIQLRVAMTGTTFFEMRQVADKSVGFRVVTNGTESQVDNFNGITATPAVGDVVSLEVRLKSGSTTEYEAYAVYGAFNTTRATVQTNAALNGTSAQGQEWYGPASTFTITAS